jgi:hypothetical protein
VSNGKQRIASLKDEAGGMTAGVLFARTKNQSFFLDAPLPRPRCRFQSGEAGPVKFDALF